jgi:hypothetical protein
MKPMGNMRKAINCLFKKCKSTYLQATNPRKAVTFMKKFTLRWSYYTKAKLLGNQQNGYLISLH